MTENPDIHEVCRKGNIITIEELLSCDPSQVNSRDKETRTPVMVAAQHGNCEIYDYLVSKGCDLSKRDNKNNTLLHIACKGGSVHIAEDLLSRNVVCINCPGHDGKTPVMSAAERGNREVFFLLLDRGCALPIADRCGNVIFHWACYGGSVEIVEYLLSQDRPDIDAKGNHDVTPIMIAAYRGHRAVFDMLVTRGCDLSLLDVHSKNILHHACSGGNEEIVEYLLSKTDIDINMRSKGGLTPVMISAFNGFGSIFCLLVTKGCDLTGVNRFGDYILHQACIGGSAEIVDYLLEKRMGIDKRGQFGGTPAMMATLKGKRDLLELLINKGCNLMIRDNYGDSVLHHAARGGSAEIVDLILSQNVPDIDGTGRNGLTPVMIAAEKAHRDVFYLLVAQGFDLDGVSRLGDTLLHCACIGGNVEIVGYLLSLAATDVNSTGQLGATPVMMAAQKARHEVFELLVDRGCDLTTKDENKDTLLHHACSGGSVDIVKYLLSLEIFYINSRGQEGMTPVMMAVYGGHRDVFDLLVRENCDTSLLSSKHLSVLHVACLSGVVDVAEKLICDVNELAYRGGDRGRTPLMMAALKGHKLLFDLLLSKGSDVTTVDNDLNNILHFSCLGGNVDIVDYLLCQNIQDINSRGQSGRTGVMMAAECSHLEVFNLLVKRGCDLSVVDTNHNNILHAACIGGSREIVEFVLSQNIVDINDTGDSGKTAAQLAAMFGHWEITEVLGTKSVKKSRRFSKRAIKPSPVKHHTE